MGDKSWEDMAREVLVDGRPDKIASAALGWQELIKNLGEVKESLETNVKDLNATWKGPGYDAFKGHIEKLAKNVEQTIDDVDNPGRGKVSLIATLNTAASQLEEAQAKMPIPAAAMGDVLAARNGEMIIGVGLFETRVKADVLGSWPVEQIGKFTDWLTGWFSDQEGEARQVYNEVNGNFRDRVRDTGESGNVTGLTPDDMTPFDPSGGGGGVPPGGMPGAGGLGDTPGLGATPSVGGVGGVKPPGTDGFTPTTHPDLGSGGGYDDGPGTYPGTGDYPGGGGLDDDEWSSGLAGAGGPSTPGLGSAGGGGLPGGSGLGSGGVGAGGGLGGGGGAMAGAGIGRAVSPGMPPMVGGGGAGAGRGGGKAGGGRLGAAGMGPMMGGGAGAGRGGAGAGRAGAGATARGGVAGMAPGATRAGYGEEDEGPRNTWLEEDEDVWGTSGGGAPGILR